MTRRRNTTHPAPITEHDTVGVRGAGLVRRYHIVGTVDTHKHYTRRCKVQGHSQHRNQDSRSTKTQNML